MPQLDTPPGSYDRPSHTISLDHQLRLRTPIAAIPAGALLRDCIVQMRSADAEQNFTELIELHVQHHANAASGAQPRAATQLDMTEPAARIWVAP